MINIYFLNYNTISSFYTDNKLPLAIPQYSQYQEASYGEPRLKGKFINTVNVGFRRQLQFDALNY